MNKGKGLTSKDVEELLFLIRFSLDNCIGVDKVREDLGRPPIRAERIAYLKELVGKLEWLEMSLNFLGE